MKAVEFDHLVKDYGQLRALNDVSFCVEQGQFFGLLGPNGAGKSTLINTMAGLVKATSGQVKVMGHDVVASATAARRALGLVPQELIADPFFNIRQLLTLQSGYFGLRGAKQQTWIDELLVRLSLTDKAGVDTQQLSGGMKRRVLIAMALVHRPQVIVLDEPTAGVDVDLRRTLWQFANELHQQGHTIILTTHYLEEAESLCDSVGIMQKGQLIALEKTQDLIARHPFRHLQLELEQPVDLAGLLNRAEFAKDVFDVQKLSAIKFRIKLAKTVTTAQMLAWAQQQSVAVADIRWQDAKLEEVFLNITESVS
jgi:ABC-2 type transport system ATP-binding protein